MTDLLSRPWLRRRGKLLAGLAAAALLAAAPASAAPTYAFDIAAGPLDISLLRLARETHEQVFFSKALVAGRRAPALKGRYTPEQALALILASTDLTVSRAGPHLLVLQRSPPAPMTRQPVREVEADRPFVTAALAQRTDERSGASPEAEPANTVEAVEVTGSHIRGATTASPLVVLSHEDLERSGQTTVADALRSLPQNFGGGAAEGTVNTGADRVGRNTAFGSALNLRGLGPSATLVLINGRRMAGSGTFGDFSDISTIPTAAVARVEVLLDGASALYGSDAVGGVVNVITRKNYEGAETRVLGGVATAGEPAQAQISQTVGKRWAGGGLVFAYELQRRDALSADDRRFAASSDLRALGGTDQRQTNSFPGNIQATDPITRAVVPTYGIPAGQNGIGLSPTAFRAGVINLQNQRQGGDILPRQTLNSVYLAADQEVGERVQLTADARFSSRRFKAHGAPLTSTFTVNRSNPFYVSPIGATSESIAYSFVGDLPNPVSSGSVESLALSLGASGNLTGDWRVEGYGTFAQEIDEVRGGGFINSLKLNEALGTMADRADTSFSASRDGYFNPFTGIAGSNSATVLNYIGSGATISRSRGRVGSVNVQADGTLWELPAGAVKLAAGGQARRETLVKNGSNFLSTVAPVAQAPTDVSRDVTAAFAELRVPLFGGDFTRPGLERLELSLAGRIEHYEAVGTTANPKVGVLWQPAADLQLRGTYGTSFRAPALREINDTITYAPGLLNLGTGKGLTLVLGGGNPDLKPETATSWTLGADFRPARWPGLRLGVTGFDVRFHNRIDRPVQANLANALQDPTLARFVTRLSPTTSAADLALISEYLASPFLVTAGGTFPASQYVALADNRYLNTARLHVRGVDLNAAYDAEINGDRISLNATATYLFDYVQQLTPTSRSVNQVNVANFPVRFRGRATADWTRGRLTLGGAFNYVSAYHDFLGARIGDQPTFDLQARLAPAGTGPLQGVSVLFNIRNVFDRDPPFYNNPFGLGYDPSNADPIGRFVSLQLTRAW